MPVPDSEADVLMSDPISDVAGVLSGETVGVATGSGTGVTSGEAVNSDETGVSTTGSTDCSVGDTS